MDFLDALETRHSIRAYADTPVEDKKPEKTWKRPTTRRQREIIRHMKCEKR